MAGGALLVISPKGHLLGIPLYLLAHSPFTSFLIPGLILFTIIGLCPCLLVVALINKPANKYFEYLNYCKDMHWAWGFTIYIAFALIIWIQVETIFVGGTSWLQTFYLLYAIPIILIALHPQVRNFYKK